MSGVSHADLGDRLAVGWQVDDDGALAALCDAARSRRPLEICNWPTIERLAELAALGARYGFAVRWEIPPVPRTVVAWVDEAET